MADQFVEGRTWDDGDVVTPGRLNDMVRKATATDTLLALTFPRRVLARAEKAQGSIAEFYSASLAATHEGFNNEDWWRVLLSNLVQDDTGSASVNGDNQLVLPAAKWRYRVVIPNIGSSEPDNGIRARLWNVSDGSLVELSTSLWMEEQSSSTAQRGGSLEIAGEVTLAAAKTLEVQIRCTQGTGTTLHGNQRAADLGGDEYYCVAEFWAPPKN